MNIAAVEHLASLGVTLIITVDNGISSIREVERAKALGVDVVVTDHHRPQETLPAAVAVVDAYRKDDESPCKDFSGAGIAFKLLMALEEGAGDLDDLLETYGDLAAIGTIGDVVPLTGEKPHAGQRGAAPAFGERAARRARFAHGFRLYRAAAHGDERGVHAGAAHQCDRAHGRAGARGAASDERG